MMALLTSAVVSVLALEPAEAPTVELELDLSALPDDVATNDIRQWLLEDEKRLLEEGEIRVVDDAPHTIRVAIRRYGEGDIHYEATVTLTEDGEADPRAERTLQCEACTDTELVAKVVGEVARMSGLIVYANDPAEAPPPAADGPPTDPPEAPPGRTDDRRIGPMGIAGAVITGPGRSEPDRGRGPPLP